MSGLFTAAFLQQIGWDVDVFERAHVELIGRGARITTQAVSLRKSRRVNLHWQGRAAV